MTEILRGLFLLACVGLLAFGILRLTRRFRATEQSALRILIIAWSAVWLLLIVPAVGVLGGDLVNDHFVITSGTIALWPICVLWITRNGFNSAEWEPFFGVDRRREAQGDQISSRDKILSNILLGLGAVAFFAYAIYVFVGR